MMTVSLIQMFRIIIFIVWTFAWALSGTGLIFVLLIHYFIVLCCHLILWVEQSLIVPSTFNLFLPIRVFRCPRLNVFIIFLINRDLNRCRRHLSIQCFILLRLLFLYFSPLSMLNINILNKRQFMHETFATIAIRKILIEFTFYFCLV